MKLYADRDPCELEPYYSRHVEAMTAEGLRSKAAIAEELAYRDQQIERLNDWIVELNGFRSAAASCIKSGERWTPTMQAAFDRSERPETAGESDG